MSSVGPDAQSQMTKIEDCVDTVKTASAAVRTASTSRGHPEGGWNPDLPCTSVQCRQDWLEAKRVFAVFRCYKPKDKQWGHHWLIFGYVTDEVETGVRTVRYLRVELDYDKFHVLLRMTGTFNRRKTALLDASQMNKEPLFAIESSIGEVKNIIESVFSLFGSYQGMVNNCQHFCTEIVKHLGTKVVDGAELFDKLEELSPPVPSIPGRSLLVTSGGARARSKTPHSRQAYCANPAAPQAQQPTYVWSATPGAPMDPWQGQRLGRPHVDVQGAHVPPMPMFLTPRLAARRASPGPSRSSSVERFHVPPPGVHLHMPQGNALHVIKAVT